jgi:hypothetical protein
MKYCWIILFIVSGFVLPSGNVTAQRYKISDTTELLAQDAQRILAAINNPEATLTGQNFATIWSGGQLSVSQQSKVAALSKRMFEKGQHAIPQWENFLALVSYSILNGQIKSGNFDEMLSMLEKSLETYDNKVYNKILQTLRDYFQYKMLYRSNFNRLYANNGTYRFEFLELAPAPSEVPVTEDDNGFFNDWDQTNENETKDSGWDDNGWGETGETDKQPEQQSGWDTQNSWEAWEEPATQTNNAELTKQEALLNSFTKTPQPELEGPVMYLDGVDFNFASTYDSAFLKKTNGGVMLHRDLWVGKTGTFDFSPSGFDPEQVYCNLDEYNFDISKCFLSAENVELTYKGLIADPVEGVLEFDTKRHKGPEDADYPRFKSYYSEVRLDNWGHKGVIFIGGFALRGRKMYGNSVFPGNSKLMVQDEKGIQFVSRGENFIMKDSLVTSDESSISIFHHQDSLFHPNTKLRYDLSKKILTVIKGDNSFKVTPFTSTFYNMDIQADMLKWDLNTDSLDIRILNARKHIPATFESSEYFSEDRFNRLSGFFGFNPLLVAVSYARKINSAEYPVEDLAREIRQKPEIVRDAMAHLMYRKFVEFDKKTGIVRINRKGFHNVLAKNYRIDYDDLLIPSLITNQPNATFDLKNQEMKVRGIEQFYISRLLDVYIYPTDNSITLLRNRDFKFDGQLFAGNFELVGRDFTFRYDSFLIELNQIDSIRFYIEVQEDNSRSKGRKKVDNKLVVENLQSSLNDLSTNFEGNSGVLYINRPDNKSSRKIYPNYPNFNASKGAVVYFDQKDILDSAYDRSVYFVIPPFSIDSLSDSDPAAIGFEGTFVSGGLLPDFKTSLKIMKDNSLGFEHRAPEEGYQLYNGEGKFYNELKLDKNGLRGKGQIEYLTSTLISDDFIFYQDSVITKGSKVVMDKGTLAGTSFPNLKINNYSLRWLPQKDSMYLSNLEKPISLYDSTGTLNGTAIINKNGVYGKGKLVTRGSQAISKNFNFKENEYNARHAKFRINSDNPKKPALAGDDVRLSFDLVENIADISPEVEGVAAIDFPYAQVKTSISKAVWDMDLRKVTMEKPEDVNLRNSYFYATRKELDSLAFNATAAEYDIEKLALTISGIPYIVVADAKITPENNQVTIFENAKINELKNTTIVMDTLNEYHQLYNGNINIVSRNKFLGNATYRYMNTNNDTFSIQFRSFDLEETLLNRRQNKLRTVSSGQIEEKDNFIISPGMIYKGDVTMYADVKPLELDGFVKLNFKTISSNNTWIVYQNNDENRQEVMFDFANSLTDKGESLTAGLHFDERSDSLYSTFITEKITPGDEDFFVPDGMLFYDQEKELFRIEDTLKSIGKKFSGKMFSFNELNKDISFEGPLQFISSTNPGVSLASSGIGKGNILTGTYDINAFLSIDFEIPDNAVSTMGIETFDIIERLNAAEANPDLTKLLYKAAEIIGESAATVYDNRSRQEYVPLVEVSNNLIKDLVLSDINLKWSSKHRAWYNEGPIGLSNILRQDINGIIDGFVEIRKTENGDLFNLFLQISPETWYYFNYYENRLITFSSNEEYNDIISSKTNINKAKLGEYVFVPGDIAEALDYVNRFRKSYYGIEEPYRMDMIVKTETQSTLPIPQEIKSGEIKNDTEGF